ncbi:glycoside hydrolase family 5 protein [Opitutus terrae]|uniref:Glycoside hydrolase family 5 n=1 Tax=Opitutus terrae (strain DSM 11246 / JCM 15787 / PB90-1) TaxID=452637 RepID=B1ZXQ3_OPITP|nr:cellulase family glycosylhydrolase [Opitutus terrae]ACB74275.1 glycoside hydrolase family 5 [Opitutus terrae PB90-1]
MPTSLNRREFVKGVSLAAAASLLDLTPAGAAEPLPQPSPQKLPRWRGFNLLEKFIASVRNEPFREADFEFMAEWGFNFARVPMSYRCWSDPKNWRQIREPVMREIDQVVELGRRYGVHLSLNFHRAPGYSVDASLQEPFNLWTDAEALEACAYHWRHFAERYKHVPSTQLSFDLVNEPGFMREQEFLDDATYFRVAKALVAAIRAESPERLIIADGLSWGRIPVPALAELGIAQSTRGYEPMQVSHWKADWVAGSDQWPEPTWPLPVRGEAVERERQGMAQFKQVFRDNPIVQKLADDPVLAGDWNRERIEHQLIRPWQELEALGVGVHVGEFGAHNATPHPVVLGWIRDLLGAWKSAGWGYAMWNLRGSFGVLDSERADVRYENFRGHKLDRKLLELLREF